jgi:mannose-1-phosphate guanylyltransferase/phosphomannomutase
MRHIMQDTDGKRRDLVDGVKIYFNDDSSALLIPDKELPMFLVSAEATTKEAAERLAAEFERKVTAWRDEQ